MVVWDCFSNKLMVRLPSAINFSYMVDTVSASILVNNFDYISYGANL